MKWNNQLIEQLQWSNTIINRAGKERVAKEVADIAKNGDIIGAGSGSTVYLTLFALAERIRKEALHIEIIPASNEISMTCIQLNIHKPPFGINVPTGLLTEPTRSIRNIT